MTKDMDTLNEMDTIDAVGVVVGMVVGTVVGTVVETGEDRPQPIIGKRPAQAIRMSPRVLVQNEDMLPLLALPLQQPCLRRLYRTLNLRPGHFPSRRHPMSHQ